MMNKVYPFPLWENREVTAMNIRLAEIKDIPRLLDLLLQVEKVHHDIRPDIFAPGGQKYDASALEALLSQDDKPIFVAEIGSFVAGYCFCQLRQYSNALFCPRKELYIDDLCVDAACRGQGIGKALYRHAVSCAKDKGCNFVSLNVWCGNDSAMEFYHKAGLRSRNIYMEMPLEEE